MASSPPANDVPAAPAQGETRLDTVATQIVAIDTLIDLAGERLLVFDRDLSEGGWSGARRAERLVAFLRRSRNSRLSIIVHEPRYLEASCPRLADLLKVYSHAMQVWRTGPDARGAMDALVIADDRHFLHRYHVDQPRATLAIDLPAAAKPLVARFEEIWATGEPALGGSVLGL
jgi:hypothetical protein